MMAAEIAAALGDARPDGNEWRSRCPSCHNRNLTLADSASGKRLLVKCFNDCSRQKVLAELRRLARISHTG